MSFFSLLDAMCCVADVGVGVVDENIWTSSGISAGTDLAFAWIADVFGEEQAQFIADRSEYERNTDSGNDRYAERWGAV